jgi:nicotinamide-nucleotide amidase
MSFDAESFLELCREKDLSFVSAESCTGGLIAGALTEIAGSSDVVWGGFVTYANEAKQDVLGVPSRLIEEKGAVSEEVVRAMVGGALQKSGAGVAVAVSGVAGPGGGSPEKPVGTVWIAAGTVNACRAERFLFSGDRAEVRRKTVEEALLFCEKVILNESSLDSNIS